MFELFVVADDYGYSRQRNLGIAREKEREKDWSNFDLSVVCVLCFVTVLNPIFSLPI